MSASSYKDLIKHIDHEIVIVKYGNVNVTIECEDCCEVIMSFDKERKKKNAKSNNRI